MSEAPEELYLSLLKRVLTRELFLQDDERAVIQRPVRAQNWKRWFLDPAQRLLGQRGYTLTYQTRGRLLRDLRAVGLDWPAEAETMVGSARLNNLHECVRTVITEDVPGDVMETGVWRGGAVIFMRAALAAYGDQERLVWAADSFQGLPKAVHALDVPDDLSGYDELAVSLDDVKANFERYGLLDERVRFVVGWFSDTLSSIETERLAVLRLDGDYYESTRDALTALYPKVSVGGYVIVDDYGQIAGCRAAVDEYRAAHEVVEPIQRIDHSGVFWRRDS